jgi:hypothetical protein
MIGNFTAKIASNSAPSSDDIEGTVLRKKFREIITLNYIEVG